MSQLDMFPVAAVPDPNPAPKDDFPYDQVVSYGVFVKYPKKGTWEFHKAYQKLGTAKGVATQWGIETRVVPLKTVSP